MKYLSLSLFFATFIILGLYPLNAQQKNEKSGDILSKEYYSQLGSNLERLHQLRTGTFIQTLKNDAGDLIPWYVNDGEDSVMIYATAVGDPSKNGYWIYYHQFMSNMPDQPLASALEHIVPISRDSFRGQLYKCPFTLTLKQAIQAKKTFKNLNFKKLEKSREVVHYWRVDYTEFHAFSEPYFRTEHDRAEGLYYTDYYQITAKHIRYMGYNTNADVSLAQIKLNIPNGEEYKTHLVRLYPEQTVLFSKR